MPAIAEAGALRRREFLRGMAASAATAALAGCGRSPVGAVPYVERPEEVVPGRPLFYATAIPFAGFAQPVLAETHMGRPTKLEGNPDHPVGGGATDAFTQAAVAALYGPERSRRPLRGGVAAAWADFAALAPELAGPGLRVLTGAVGSPTLVRQLTALVEEAGARWHVHEPGLPPPQAGRPSLHPRLDAAGAVVCLDADPLGPGPAQVAHVRAWSAAPRRPLFVAEPTLSPTGAVARRRLAAPAGRVPVLARALAAELGLGQAPPLADDEAAWVAEAVAALAAQPGESLLLAGPTQPGAIRDLALAVNARLGNLGRTLLATEPVLAMPPGGDEFSLAALVEDMRGGRVRALLVLEANPAYTQPAGLDFAAAARRVPWRIHAGLCRDETAALCHWHLPLHHPLEDWSDARAVDGTAGIIQPVTRPLHESVSAHAVLAALLGEPGADPREVVRDTWRRRWDEDDFEARWRRALHDGFVADTGAAPLTLAPPPLPPPEPDEVGGLEAVFRPDPCVWDGRFAAVPWLQELPKPLTTLTWTNVVALGAGLAGRLGVATGDTVEVSAAGAAVAAPAWIMPGQAEASVTLFLGYGRRNGAGVGRGRGYDAYPLRPGPQGWRVAGVRLRRLDGAAAPLPVIQPHQTLAGLDDIVRTVAPGAAVPPPAAAASLYPEWEYPGPAWGMVIDLDRCTGCNACVVACQMENAVPTVGPSEVAKGRALHWLRVDLYYQERPEGLRTYFQPVPCMHCEKAPCEFGCPVNATVHGPEGLNQMVYNRCIGTRTCSSYCPYKVRRFNFRDYAGAMPAAYAPLRNPDVTVRAQGVMEKCTYCTQRIAAARIEARKDNRPIRDGEVRTACQQACPARAIVFGDLADPGSAVARARDDRRHYGLLAHLGTRPRTTYLARTEAR